VSSRAASIFVAASASFHWMAWKLPMVLPNARRSRAYPTAASYAPWARPTASAAMPIRPASSTCIVLMKPRPSSPTS